MSPALPNLAFAALNLRRNPFGALDDDDEARVAVIDLGELGKGWIGATPRRPRAIEFVGPPGAGKSTRLRALARARGATVWAWSAETGWPRGPAAGDEVFIDDAQMLPARHLARLVRGRTRVALASHESRHATLQARGCTVSTVDVPTAGGEGHLAAVVARRLEAARRGPGPLPRVGEARLAALERRHGPDLRAMLSDLYLWIQTLAEAA